MNYNLRKLGFANIEFNSLFSPAPLVYILSHFQLYNFEIIFRKMLHKYFYEGKIRFSAECIFRRNCEKFFKEYISSRKECSFCMFLRAETDTQSISVGRGMLLPNKKSVNGISTNAIPTKKEQFYIQLCNDMLFDYGFFSITNHKYISCARNMEELKQKILLLAFYLGETKYRIADYEELFPEIDSFNLNDRGIAFKVLKYPYF